MNPRTELVMGRYRELKKVMSGLEASRVVLKEAEEGTLGRTESRTETPRTDIRTDNKRTGRPKKWASEAERLRAYRERK